MSHETTRLDTQLYTTHKPFSHFLLSERFEYVPFAHPNSNFFLIFEGGTEMRFHIPSFIAGCLLAICLASLVTHRKGIPPRRSTANQNPSSHLQEGEGSSTSSHDADPKSVKRRFPEHVSALRGISAYHANNRHNWTTTEPSRPTRLRIRETPCATTDATSANVEGLQLIRAVLTSTTSYPGVFDNARLAFLRALWSWIDGVRLLP